MTDSISNQQARQLVLHLQGLTHAPHVGFEPGGLYALIRQLGFVQVDSIQWVERAQHMILFARNQTYRPGHLKRLLEKDRMLFENWTHDASVIPSEFYPYWRHRFERRRSRIASQFSNWQGEGYSKHCSELLDRITRGGPLRSRDLERAETGPLEMWQWHDGKAALEYLWRTGALCISGRDGFQKIYDLAHKGIPADHHQCEVDHVVFVDWACRSALERLGFGTAADIARFWDHLTIDEVKGWLAEQDHKSILPVKVAGMKGVRGAGEKELWARGDLSSLIDALPSLPKRIRALSPFDPVIRDRKRLTWLFGFDYRIEIYVPEAKRVWGYYVFPLLEGDRLIGRIDMRARRSDDVLEVKRLWLEPGIKLSNARRERLDAELTRQARLGGVKGVRWLDGALA